MALKKNLGIYAISTFQTLSRDARLHFLMNPWRGALCSYGEGCHPHLLPPAPNSGDAIWEHEEGAKTIQIIQIHLQTPRGTVVQMNSREKGTERTQDPKFEEAEPQIKEWQTSRAHAGELTRSGACRGSYLPDMVVDK